MPKTSNGDAELQTHLEGQWSDTLKTAISSSTFQVTQYTMPRMPDLNIAISQNLEYNLDLTVFQDLNSDHNPFQIYLSGLSLQQDQFSKHIIQLQTFCLII